jgi:RNA polymerase primary sigma factor
MTDTGRYNELPLLNAFIRDIRRFPMLSREEELALVAQAASGDRVAENRLVESNLRYVVKVGFSYWQWASSRYPASA